MLRVGVRARWLWRGDGGGAFSSFPPAHLPSPAGNFCLHLRFSCYASPSNFATYVCLPEIVCLHALKSFHKDDLSPCTLLQHAFWLNIVLENGSLTRTGLVHVLFASRKCSVEYIHSRFVHLPREGDFRFLSDFSQLTDSAVTIGLIARCSLCILGASLPKPCLLFPFSSESVAQVYLRSQGVYFWPLFLPVASLGALTPPVSPPARPEVSISADCLRTRDPLKTLTYGAFVCFAFASFPHDCDLRGS